MADVQDKVLVVGPSWVGDMIMAHSLVQIVAAAQPARLSVLAPEFMSSLLSRMPGVTDAITTPFAHGRLQMRERWRIAARIRQVRFDRAIILPGSFKAALVPFLARIPQRVGFLGEKRYGLINDIRSIDLLRVPLATSRFAQLGLPSDTAAPLDYPPPRLNSQPQRVAKLLNEMGYVAVEKPILALCPGAEFGPAKRWPIEHYARVGQTKRNEGWQVWVIGSNADYPLGETIRKHVGQDCFNLAGKTRLDDAIDLISVATCVVTNDSGLMHIAAALGRPLIAVYGSTSPEQTPPLTPNAQILKVQLDCSPYPNPCFQRTCPLQHMDCLTRISALQVLNAISHLPLSPVSWLKGNSEAPL